MGPALDENLDPTPYTLDLFVGLLIWAYSMFAIGSQLPLPTPNGHNGTGADKFRNQIEIHLASSYPAANWIQAHPRRFWEPISRWANLFSRITAQTRRRRHDVRELVALMPPERGLGALIEFSLLEANGHTVDGPTSTVAQSFRLMVIIRDYVYERSPCWDVAPGPLESL